VLALSQKKTHDLPPPFNRAEAPATPGEAAPTPIPELRPRLASLSRRFASLAYEGILVIPVLFITAYLFLALTQAARTPLAHALFQLWLVGVLGVYFVFCWSRSGQTLAMKTWRIRVARADGSALSSREALARFLLALWGFFLFGAGFWWAFVDRDRQFLHDRLTGSRLFSAA
jgi:uncharacterized RDD family membrane protein YckC